MGSDGLRFPRTNASSIPPSAARTSSWTELGPPSSLRTTGRNWIRRVLTNPPAAAIAASGCGSLPTSPRIRSSRRYRDATLEILSALDTGIPATDDPPGGSCATALSRASSSAWIKRHGATTSSSRPSIASSNRPGATGHDGPDRHHDDHDRHRDHRQRHGWWDARVRARNRGARSSSSSAAEPPREPGTGARASFRRQAIPNDRSLPRRQGKPFRPSITTWSAARGLPARPPALPPRGLRGLESLYCVSPAWPATTTSWSPTTPKPSDCSSPRHRQRSHQGRVRRHSPTRPSLMNR
jgi:hypothetical protein